MGRSGRPAVGGLLAAVFGMIDWLALPAGTRARSIALSPAAATS